MKLNKISIVTIVLNEVHNIEKTITSVLNQDYPNLEYIVIDGGSNDGTLEVLNKYKHKFKYFISSSDKGIYDAMNKGIVQASGDLIGFVNGGDFIYQGALNSINQAFCNQNSNFFFSVGNIDFINKDDQIIGSRISRSTEQIIKRKFLEMPTNHLGIFVPLETFKKYGLFDLRFKYRADFFFVLNLLINGYKPLKIPKKVGAFRLGGISGGYSTFFENFKIILLSGGSYLIAFYSTFLGVSKLFFQKNLPVIYKYIARIYYNIEDLGSKNRLLNQKLNFIHIIDSDSGGGAEKLVSFIQNNLPDNQKVITLKQVNKKKYLNSNYDSLNIKANGPLTIIIATFKLIKTLFKIENRKNIVLHSHLSKSLYATFLPSILFGIKHIHTEHNTHNKRRTKSYLYPLEFLIYNSLKHIIYVSEPTRYEFLTYMPRTELAKTSVIENGTKLYQHKERDFTKKKYNILLLGSLTYKKGFDLLIEILPSLSDRINQVKIVGSGPENNKLLDLTKKHSLEKIVKFIPFTENPSVHIYDSDIGIIPSRWEGFGLIAVEMRSSGLPILISDTSGLYDIFSSFNGVYGFKNGSKQSLRDTLSLLINNLGNNKVSIDNITSEFEIYSEKSFIKRYDEFYKTISS